MPGTPRLPTTSKEWIVLADAGISFDAAAEPVLMLATLLVAIAALSGLAWRRKRFRQSTLMAVWWWALAALCAVSAVELCRLLLGAAAASQLTALRYAAAMLTFCPMMALLGAKRPQNHAWQWIVLSLWIILLIPAIQWWLNRPSDSMHVFAAWRWLLLVLLAVSVANYLPTRYRATAVLATFGQMVLISEQLPLGGFSLPAAGGETTGPLLGLTSLAAAVWLVHWADARRVRPPRGIDRVWIDFRDWFGVVWAVRVGQQINSYSTMYGWRIALSWNGLQAVADDDQEGNAVDESELAESTRTALRKSLRTTLRRFVPPDWIAERLAEGDAVE